MPTDYIILSVLFVIAIAGGSYLKHESRKYRIRKDNERAAEHRHAH